jgi:HD-GYP domain-containing protein (c-di-GMP phosphodiesterase class II)
MDMADDKGVVGFVIKTRKPLIVKKGDNQAQSLPGGEVLIYSTLLAVPIVEKGEVRGVIGVCDQKYVDRIDTDDLFLLENISGQIATTIENIDLNNEIDDTYYETLVMLARVVEAKDPYSAGHLERVASYVDAVAIKLRLDGETRKILHGGALLHDLGKVGIRDDILKKTGKFTDDEYAIMKEHSMIGENILKPLRSMIKLAELVRHHHEHYDGTGYPDGLKGEEIPITSRILAIADVYDSITTDRPYRKAMTKNEATKVLREEAGTKLDPKLVDLFINSMQ